MKKRIIVYTLLLLAGANLFSCMEKSERFGSNTPSAETIQFQVDDKALTGLSTFGAVQPSMDVVAARFSRNTPASPNYFGGNIVVTANLSSNMTNLTINMYLQVPNPIRETKATITGIIGTTTWTQAITTLLYNNVAVTNTSYILEFVASNADGTQTTIRTFTLTIIA